jgi:hypothetical protein
MNVLDLWQNVLDDTKARGFGGVPRYDFVDDSIDRIRDDDDDHDDVDLADDIDELRKAVAELSAKLDRLTTASK